MKTEQYLNYESPQVEVVEAEVEKEFAVSVGNRVNGWDDGGSFGNYDVNE